MSNRRAHHRGRRDSRSERYVRLPEYLLASLAWRSLDCVARALYVEIARRYRGPNSNNGKIPFAVREAAGALNISPATAKRAFDHLLDRGFLRVGAASGFNMKGRIAREWLLTEFSDDTSGVTVEPTKDFMRWSEPAQPKKGRSKIPVMGSAHAN